MPELTDDNLKEAWGVLEVLRIQVARLRQVNRKTDDYEEYLSRKAEVRITIRELNRLLCGKFTIKMNN